MLIQSKSFSKNKDDAIFLKEVIKTPRFNKESRYKNFISVEELLGIDDVDNDYFLTNSLGHRSQEFTSIHNGSHILFAGCSETVGEGLSLSETWSFKLFKKINELETLSGYYNLSSGGIGFATIIPNIFKYINNYGKPKTIFINMPNILRFYAFNNNEYYYDPNIEQQTKKLLSIEEKQEEYAKFYVLFYQYFMMLEKFCESNDIKLLTFSWDNADREHKDSVMSTQEFFEKYPSKAFFSIDKNKMAKHVEEYIAANKQDKKFALIARDGAHSGIAINDFWSSFMFEKYVELSK